MTHGDINHMVGDYLVQSNWMAQQKTSNKFAALTHVLSYTACFLPITRSPKALAFIGGTHFVIDHWRLARHVAWFKNQLVPRAYRYPWSANKATGYKATDPIWLTTWLMIIADNTMHVALNRWALNRWGK